MIFICSYPENIGRNAYLFLHMFLLLPHLPLHLPRLFGISLGIQNDTEALIRCATCGYVHSSTTLLSASIVSSFLLYGKFVTMQASGNCTLLWLNPESLSSPLSMPIPSLFSFCIFCIFHSISLYLHTFISPYLYTLLPREGLTSDSPVEKWIATGSYCLFGW